MRARVLVFIAALMVLAVLPIPSWLALWIGCFVYCVVVLPAIARR